jgi:hypothetical protein
LEILKSEALKLTPEECKTSEGKQKTFCDIIPQDSSDFPFHAGFIQNRYSPVLIMCLWKEKLHSNFIIYFVVADGCLYAMCFSVDGGHSLVIFLTFRN